VGIDDTISPARDAVAEARGLRQQVLNTSLLIAVVVGGLAFVRTIIDAVGLGAWRVGGVAVAMYAGFIFLFFARRLPYRVRALGFLALLYVLGVLALLSVGYLAAPVLVLAGENILAAVLFGRRVTAVALVLNLLALLGVGAALSTGVAQVETVTFYEPDVFMHWLRITAIFAVFAAMAVVSVDVIMNHLKQSLRDQAELIENLKGAMQLHDAAESQRRAAESRLREAQKRNRKSPPPSLS
jgi:hypothetical protein